MTFREVKVAEFEHFAVFFPDNRDFGKSVLGAALTEDGKIRAKKSDGSPARGSVENLVSPWNGYSRAKNRPAEQKRERFHAPSSDLSQEFNLLSDICGDHHRLRLWMVLSKLDFRVASGQFASAGMTRNPDLPEEIVAAHALENELGICRRPKTFASLGHSI